MTALSALFSRGATYIVFVVVIAAVSLFRHSQNHPHPISEWISESPLPPNTRIKISELKKPDVPAGAFNLTADGDLDGKYVDREISEKCPVVASNLRSTPSLPEMPDTALLFFDQKESASVIDHVNTNDTVYLSGKETEPGEKEHESQKGPYPVATVLGKKETRVLVIRVPLVEVRSIRSLKEPVFSIASLRARDTAPSYNESHRCG